MDDGAFCPLCSGRMSYTWRTQEQLGDFTCAECKFKRAEPHHRVNSVVDSTFIIDHNVAITPSLPGLHSAYNIVAAFTVAVDVFGMTQTKAAEALTNSGQSKTYINREQRMIVGNSEIIVLHTKHENTSSYNGAFRLALDSTAGSLTVAVVVDHLSYRYLTNSICWLWDTDFEVLNDPRVTRVILGGIHAHDMALRLIYAGYPSNRLRVAPTYSEVAAELQNTSGHTCLLANDVEVVRIKQALKDV
jgi:UDP-N-acetylmuramyl tripeptide synthase